MALMTIDIGTSGVKTIIFSKDGEIISKSGQKNKIIHPTSQRSEMNPEDVWKNIVKSSREANTKINEKIEGISLSCLGDEIIPVDKKGNTTHISRHVVAVESSPYSL